jgi:hypothetical protein
MLDRQLRPHERVFAFSQIPEAYTTREAIIGGHSSFGDALRRAIWTPITPDFFPTRITQFTFPRRTTRSIRIMQTAADSSDFWNITEIRMYAGGKELPRHPGWRLRAHPNPWEVQSAFDNSAVTRWSSQEPLFPGMFIEVNFADAVALDTVVLQHAADQPHARVHLEGIDAKIEESETAPPLNMRWMAGQELYFRGVQYLLLHVSDPGFEEVRRDPWAWRAVFVLEDGPWTLYRINP